MTAHAGSFTGCTVGPYKVLSLLGSGGMGEVYLAEDARLGRKVALKFLPQRSTQDRERVRRFEQEARAASALNHPNIITVYDVGEHEKAPYIAMEHVEGRTLRQRLEKGPLAPGEALRLAVQIADGLAKAHGAGIVHRDLKPENVMITSDGRVKILDFGLAKLSAPVDGASDEATRTREGAVLGTFHYMSPEQREGSSVGPRTDIFAFGCVLYEMLTGRKALGEGRRSTLPRKMERLIDACLETEPNERWQSASDLGRELIWLQNDTGAARSEATKRIWMLPLVGALLLAIFVVLLRGRPEPPPSPPTHLRMRLRPAVTLRSDTQFGRPSLTAFAISPDGREIVFSGTTGTQEPSMLYRRPLDRADATPLPGTEDAQAPFFSPDGEWIAYFANGSLRKVRVDGGMAITVVGREAFENDAEHTRLVSGWIDANENFFGGTWTADDEIVFATFLGGLWKVPSRGGEISRLTEVQPADGEYAHRLPHALPRDEAILFTIVDSPVDRIGHIGIQRLNAAGSHGVLGEGSDARFVEPGQLVFAREGNLWVMPVDVAAGQATSPALVLENLMQAVHGNRPGSHTNAAQFALSRSGDLLYVRGGPYPSVRRSLIALDRQGQELPLEANQRDYMAPRFSPMVGSWLSDWTTASKFSTPRVTHHGAYRRTLPRFSRSGVRTESGWLSRP